MNIFSVIFMNFWGFDIFIFLAALFNGAVYYMVRTLSARLTGKLKHTVYVPHYRLTKAEADKQVSELHEEDIIELHRTSDRAYSLFVNITGIFPLLGILGTVISLLGLVSDMENVTGNFYGALTSTFWGLIFAIVFKFLDGLIAPTIEHNEKSVRLYLENNNEVESGSADNAPEKPVIAGQETGDSEESGAGDEE